MVFEIRVCFVLKERDFWFRVFGFLER